MCLASKGSMPMGKDWDGNQFPTEIMNRRNHSDDFNRNMVPINNAPLERVLQIVR